MKRVLILLLALGLPLFSDNLAQQHMTVGIGPINELTFSIGDLYLYIDRKELKPHYQVTDDTSYYSILTNENAKKIVAYVDDTLPHGSELTVKLYPPAGAYSLGHVALMPYPKDLVRNINQVEAEMLGVIYDFSCSHETKEMRPQIKTITYLLVDM